MMGLGAIGTLVSAFVGRNGVLVAVIVGLVAGGIWNAVVYDAGGDAREATIIRKQGENNAQARETAQRVERRVRERAAGGGVRRGDEVKDPYARER